MEVAKENKLEEVLRLAASEPANRPQFYELLMNSQVIILGGTDAEPTGDEIDLEGGSKIQIQHWQKQDGSQVIPFFTSLEVLQHSIENEQPTLTLSARSLFEMTLGSTLVINPKSQYGKEFKPDEIEGLLSPQITSIARESVVQKGTKVLLGQPAEYPSEMIDSLTQLLPKYRNVKRAYLAQMHDGSLDEKPHLVLGIEADDDVKKVMSAINVVIRDTVPQGELVDLCLVNQFEAGLSTYFINEVMPFYEVKWGAKILSLFGLGKA